MSDTTDQRLEFFLGNYRYGRVAFLVGTHRIEGIIQEVQDGWIRVEESPPRSENGFSCAAKIRRVRISKITIVLRIEQSSMPFQPEDPPRRCTRCALYEFAGLKFRGDLCEGCAMAPDPMLEKPAEPPGLEPKPPVVEPSPEPKPPACGCTPIVRLPGFVAAWRCGQCEERNRTDRKTCRVCSHERCA